jgi:hypothetical protein
MGGYIFQTNQTGPPRIYDKPIIAKRYVAGDLNQNLYDDANQKIKSGRHEKCSL